VNGATPRREDGRPDLTVAWLAAITVLALAVRLVNLDSGLWSDEIDSLVSSFRPPLAEIVTVFPRDNRHPFYSVLAHLAILVFGEHNWVIRLPAVLFGTAPSIWDQATMRFRASAI